MEGEWNAESRVMSRFLAGPTAQKVISRAMENGGRPFSFSLFSLPFHLPPSPPHPRAFDVSASIAPLLSLEKDDWVFDIWICYIKEEGILLRNWT